MCAGSGISCNARALMRRPPNIMATTQSECGGSEGTEWNPKATAAETNWGIDATDTVSSYNKDGESDARAKYGHVPFSLYASPCSRSHFLLASMLCHTVASCHTFTRSSVTAGTRRLPRRVGLTPQPHAAHTAKFYSTGNTAANWAAASSSHIHTHTQIFISFFFIYIVK